MPETVHLAPDADFVPDHLLTPPAVDDKRHVVRGLAPPPRRREPRAQGGTGVARVFFA